MNIELVAKNARGKALEAAGYKVLTDQDKVDISEQLKQLYWHAGRWAGGARDNTARQAFHEYNRRESGAGRRVNLKTKTGRV